MPWRPYPCSGQLEVPRYLHPQEPALVMDFLPAQELSVLVDVRRLEDHTTWFLSRTHHGLVCPLPALFTLRCPLVVHRMHVHNVSTYLHSWTPTCARGYRRQPAQPGRLRVGGPLISGPGSWIRAPEGPPRIQIGRAHV